MLTLIDNLPNRESLSMGEALVHTGITQRAILHGALSTYMTDGQWRRIESGRRGGRGGKHLSS
jgi:hypothetical protein